MLLQKKLQWRAFAQEGAQVYLAGDNEASLEPVAQEIPKTITV